jgi:hypothetical protein
MYSAMVTLLLGLSLSQATEPTPTNIRFWGQSTLRLPVNGQHRPEIKQLTLYTSQDQGKSWQESQVITNKDDSFIFRAPVDGPYWFGVIATDQKGTQDPASPYEFSKHPERIQKLIIHSIKPFVRITSAQRQGEDIIVSWEIQELYPDWSTFKLEYQIQPSSDWIAVQANPALTGQVRIRTASLSNVVVKLQVGNRAKNAEHSIVEVSGSVSPAPATPPANVIAGGNQALSPPPDLPAVAGNIQNPLPLPPLTSGDPLPAQSNVPKWTPPTNPTQDTALVKVADSISGPNMATAPSTVHKPLPPVRYVNTKEVTLEYKVSKVGPSGVGSVDLWWTRNDGKTWERYADDPDAKGAGIHQRLLPLNVEDSVVGFLLVVKSKAGLGRREPRSGDVPEIRIEIDTTPPVVQLFAPVPDPQRANSLVLNWTATDKNLGTHPVNLEWAEHRDGPWYKITEHALPNTSRYSWQLPERLPVQVYLRVKVRDLAGNEGVATTNDPQLVDLSEPEGILTNVLTPQRP